MHTINIYIHAISGTLALLSGFVAFISSKGSPIHQMSGKIYLILLSIVILTGILGIVFFNVNHFLIVITLFSGYQGFSGYRIILNKKNKFNLMDFLVAFTTFASAVYYIFNLKNIGMIWSPVVIYGTIGYLFCIIIYDFGRYFFSEFNYKKIWIYEHIVKISGSYFAIFSAFTGTAIPNWQPFSQLIPSCLGIIVILYFVFTQINSKNL